MNSVACIMKIRYLRRCFSNLCECNWGKKMHRNLFAHTIKLKLAVKWRQLWCDLQQVIIIHVKVNSGKAIFLQSRICKCESNNHVDISVIGHKNKEHCSNKRFLSPAELHILLKALKTLLRTKNIVIILSGCLRSCFFYLLVLGQFKKNVLLCFVPLHK